MLNDYMNRGAAMQTADRKLHHYLSTAAYYLRQAQEYLDDYRDLAKIEYYRSVITEWPDMAQFYLNLSRYEVNSARMLVSDLESVGLISYEDWQTINHILVWFNVPAEDRYE